MSKRKPKPIATIPPRRKVFVDEGRPGLRLAVGLVVLASIGWAAWNVPIGGRTPAEHALGDSDWASVRVEAARFVRATGDWMAAIIEPAPVTWAQNEARPEAEAPRAAPPPARAEGRRSAPPERLDAADRAALEALLPE